MTEIAEKLFRQAMSLSPAERAAFIDELLRSLDTPDPSLDQLWAKEVEDRLRAFRDGAVDAVSAEEAIVLYREDGKHLPAATSGHDFASKMQVVA